MNFWIKFMHSTLDVQCRRPTPSAHHLAIMHHFFWISYCPCCWVIWYAIRNNSNLLSSLFLPFPLIVPSFHTPTLTHSSLWHRSKKLQPLLCYCRCIPSPNSQGRHFLHNIGANSRTTDILALEKGMVGKDFPSLVITASFPTFKSFFSPLFLFLWPNKKPIVPVGSLEFQIHFHVSLFSLWIHVVLWLHLLPSLTRCE